MSMDQKDENHKQDTNIIMPQKTVSINPLSEQDRNQDQKNRNAAADVIRNQINNIIDNQGITSSQSDNSNTYFRTHEEHIDPETEKWRKYHSAWQDYYQKYYEGYYAHHLKNAQKQLEEKYKGQASQNSPSKEEEMSHLKKSLIHKVKNSANKVKKSRHFWPIVSGLVAILVFLFLQFNQIVISNILAYVSPGNIDAQNIIINPNNDIAVGSESRLIIPKINIDVPVAYDVGSDYDSQMTAMDNGLAHFSIPGASAHPGEIGNTAIAGHSSSDFFGDGKYKFIFVQLDKLEAGDIIYANYNSKRYTYVVTKKEVVSPTDVDKLVYDTSIPVMTLITCTPVGTAANRLLVTAEQISPDPSKATVAASKSTQDTSSIPGNPPTLLEMLFGVRD